MRYLLSVCVIGMLYVWNQGRLVEIISLDQFGEQFEISDWKELAFLISSGAVDHYYEGGEEAEHLRLFKHQLREHFKEKPKSKLLNLSEFAKATLYSVAGAAIYDSVRSPRDQERNAPFPLSFDNEPEALLASWILKETIFDLEDLELFWNELKPGAREVAVEMCARLREMEQRRGKSQ